MGCGRIGLRGLEPGLDITGVDLARASRLPRAVRPRRRRGRAAVRRRRVRPRLLLERDRACPARRAAWRSHGSSAGSGGAGSCRPPHARSRSSRTRCCPCALAAVGLRRPYWRFGAAGELGRDLAAASGVEVEALFGPALAERLGGRSRRAGCACAAGQTADVVADAVDHEEQQQHDADRAVAVHRHQRDALAPHLLRERPEHVPAIERQEREQVDHREHERDEAEEDERVAGARDDRFVRDFGDADDAVDTACGPSSSSMRGRSR